MTARQKVGAVSVMAVAMVALSMISSAPAMRTVIEIVSAPVCAASWRSMMAARMSVAAAVSAEIRVSPLPV